MQISLKDLLAFVAFCACILGCAAWVGFDSGFFWAVVLHSVPMSVIFIWLAKSENTHRIAWIVPAAMVGWCVFIAMAMASLALFVNSVLLIGFGIFCACRPPLRIKTLFKCVAGIMLLAFVVGVLPGVSALRDLESLRVKYPIVSLVNRLKYEDRQHPIRAEHRNPDLTLVVSKRLDEFDQAFQEDRDWREQQFRAIHNHQSEVFIRSTGFGVGRMTFYDLPKDIDRPPLRNIPFDEAAVKFDDTYGNWKAFWSGNKSNAIEQLYNATANDFLDPMSFGGIVEPKVQIFGFISHALHYPPASCMTNKLAWTIQRLELVSLLKFDTPRVYVLDHLPRMDQLSGDNVPTRALDEFESGALEKLWTQEDVVVHNDGNKYRMLGSLRAANQCLNCHSVQRGELLGAFSYALLRNPTD